MIERSKNRKYVGTEMVADVTPQELIDQGVIYQELLPIGDTYHKNSLVIDGDYAGIALVDTTDRPALELISSPTYAYDGTLTSLNVTAKQIIFGQRYTFADDGVANQFRVDVIAGNVYDVYAIENPLGVPISSLLTSFEAGVSGWVDINVSDVLIEAGVTFDLIAVAYEPDPAPTSTSFNYNYTTPNSTGTPVNGQILHSDKEKDAWKVSITDSDSNDNSVYLSGLTVGDTIDGAGVTWSIQGISNQGSYYDITVAPTVQGAPDGVQQITFNTTTPVPITYGADTDHWLGNPTVQGLFIADGEYGAITPDDTQYGIDLQFQRAKFSPDWKLLPKGGSGGGSTSTVNPNNFVSEFKEAEESFFTSSVPTPLLVTDLESDNLNGFYKITVSYNYKYSRVNRKGRVRLDVDGQTYMLQEEEPKDTTNATPKTFITKAIALSGIKMIELFAWAQTNVDTITLTDVSISYQRVAQ